MRALVTGGAGVLGSHLVDRLVAAGHAVEVIDDLSGGSLGNLGPARAEALRTGSDLKIHTLDVRAPELASVLTRRPPDVVFHLAQRSAATAGERLAAELTVVGGLNVLEAAVGGGVAKVVTALDARLLYGHVATRDLPVKEAQPWQPDTLVGIAQHAVADLLAVYRTRHALEFTAVAFADVYGPRRTDGVVASLVADTRAGRPCSIDGDGRQTLDLLYVDDAVDALIRAATRGTGLVVNVGTGQQTTVRDLERMIAGPDAPAPVRRPVEGEAARFAVSSARARIHLGWAPWTSLADGLALTRAAAGQAEG
ncbi:MAG TPA: NAD-dependent epimerase/dehydratase family protein [Acidimicrobiales bacterium]